MRTPLFRSFWQAGFESAYHINRAGIRLDLIAATQHDTQVEEDYRRLHEFGIRSVREAMRWHLIDRGSHYDFSGARAIAEAAHRQGMQVVWTLCHYGWPDDVDLLAPAFVDRFARYCRAAAQFVADSGDGVPILAPMNEISFLAWGAGKKGIIHPFAIGAAGRIKQQLVRATIAGIEAIWDVVPGARIVHVDPLTHIVPPRDRPDLAVAAVAEREAQFEALEMLRGQVAPELGGHPRYLDVLGVNYYHSNQWELDGDRLRWEDHPRDDRWVPLHRLLAEVWQRFGRPLFLAETSHFGVGRGPWILEIAEEIGAALEVDVPVEGICLYPIIDRPDWDLPGAWHNSGLWDLRAADGRLERVLCEPYARELRQAQARIASRLTPPAARDPQMAGSRP